jgi:hypothetical protein
MATTRLTKNMCFSIHRALMERAYVERKEELDRKELDLGLAVYLDVYPDHVTKLMKKLPSDFFKRTAQIRVSFNDGFCHLFLPEQMPVGHNHDNNWGVANYPAEHRLTAEFLKYRKAKEEYDADYMRLSSEAWAILDRCSTVKKLVDTWPEIEPLLRQLNIFTDQFKKDGCLPAVCQDMNVLFNLPPAEATSVDTVPLAA